MSFKDFNLGTGTVKDKRRKLEAYKLKLLTDDGAYKSCQEVLHEIKKRRNHNYTMELDEITEDDLRGNFMKLNNVLVPFHREH